MKRFKIAIAGNIASGKSTVEEYLVNLGYKVLDTDKVCHELLEKSSKVKDSFKDYDILENNIISRKKLSEIVFDNEDLKKKLEQCLYPDLTLKIHKFFEQNNDKYLFVAIPLIFEANMQELFDKILFIYCDDDIRLERLIKRNNYTKEFAIKRLSSQLPQEDKLSKCDYVIKNNTTVQDLYLQTEKFLKQITHNN